MTTPKAGLRTMPTGALKNEQIFNEGVVLLEQLAYRGVISNTVTDPAGISPAPSNGDAYLLEDGSPTVTGDWSGQGGKIAVYYNGWRFIPPAEGLQVWVTDAGQMRQYRNGLWVDRDEFAPTFLNDLDDVDLSASPSAQDGDVLAYNATTEKWEHSSTAGGGSTLGTAQATTSGTSVDFTGVDAGVNEVIVQFSEVSLDAADDILVQIGDSGGIETSGYIGTSISLSSGGAEQGTSSTAGFPIDLTGGGAIWSGQMILTRIDGNDWVASHSGKQTTVATNHGGGSKSLSGELDRVRVTIAGAANFDGGKVNILYR